MTLREVVLLSLLGAALAFYKGTFRLSLDLPGHSGVVLMAIMALGKLSVPRPASGTLMATVAGLLAAFTGQGKEGPLVALKYIFPGLTLDLLTAAWPQGSRIYPGIALEGAVAHLTKLVASYVAGVILGVPRGFLVLGLSTSAVTHILFGAAGACLGLFIFNRLQRTGLFRQKPDIPPADDVVR